MMVTWTITDDEAVDDASTKVTVTPMIDDGV